MLDDPQALAGDAYQVCFGNNLVGYEKDITLKVDTSMKDLRTGLIAIYQKAVKPGDKCYLSLAMEPIYAKALDQRPGKGSIPHFTTLPTPPLTHSQVRSFVTSATRTSKRRSSVSTAPSPPSPTKSKRKSKPSSSTPATSYAKKSSRSSRRFALLFSVRRTGRNMTRPRDASFARSCMSWWLRRAGFLRAL